MANLFHQFSSVPAFRIIAASTFSVLMCAAESHAAPDSTDTLQPTATAGILWDSNLFRVPDGDTPSDRITRVGVGIKLDKTLSRQRFLANINLEQNSYERNDVLDHVAGNAGAKWLWVAGTRWDGELAYNHLRRLSQFSDLSVNNARIIAKNLVDLKTSSFSGGFRPQPRWRLWAGADFLETTNSSEQLIQNDVTIKTGSLGLDYRSPSDNTIAGSPSDNTIGLLLKYSEGLFRNREVVESRLVNNQYTETVPALALAWNLTEKSRLDGRFGYTMRKHEQFSARDFSGATFQMQYLWVTTAKLRFVAGAWRQLHTAETDTSSYVVVSGVRLIPQWLVTPKFSLQSIVSYDTRSYQGDPGVVLNGTPVREDTMRTFQIAAVYAPWRHTEILASLERGSRTSNQQQFQFDYNLVRVNLKLSF